MLTDPSPGGRHDNDHPDFRKISILPTREEIESKSTVFLRPSSFLEDAATEPNRVALHLDNQFRLLREEMLSEMKEECQIATGAKKGYSRGVKIKGLEMIALDCGLPGKREKWGLVCVCKEGLPQLSRCKDVRERKAYIDDKPQFLKHQTLTCLMAGSEIIGFASINRDEHRLIKTPPEVVLQFEDEGSAKRALYKFRLQNEVSLIQINTAVFAYEPILKGLQHANSLSLSRHLLLWKKSDVLEEVDVKAEPVVHVLRSNPGTNLKDILGTPNDIILDSSQARSLISGLTQKVSLIQGPPGTGKSFIGTLIAKAIHDFTKRSVLVVCYTNHALDDVLEGLLDIGIPESSIVRMGGKSTQRTESLLLSKHPRKARRSRGQRKSINELGSQLEKLCQIFKNTFDELRSSLRPMDFLDFLERRDGELNYFDALRVPYSQGGFKVMGPDGKVIRPEYLVDRWSRGQDAGVFKDHDVSTSENWKAVWSVSPAKRMELLDSWDDTLLWESIDEVLSNGVAYNQCQQQLMQAIRSDTTGILRSKRVVGCTTTAAAKYREEIQAFNPDVLLVEEAGEILESHVLMSLGPETSQMILIGDHKQLRPKINNYKLTVEKGNGYDLNRSLFERLILRGYPHETLSQQHRMRPEISALVRRLTYSELVDAPETQHRPDIRGVRDNVIFIDHDHLEDDFDKIAERRDMGSNISKQNSYEAKMVLKIVRYLVQQGYGTNELVILTPYLGQLQKLREALMTENSPILNELDSGELIRAGLPDPGRGNLKPIRLATIDNYQGEESDIVIVSLTRSNPRCDIGFMFSPERLNVLLSRARNGLIMLGNAHTFRNARIGMELWQTLFHVLENNNHMYRGLPVRCEQHNDTTTVLSNPNAFDEHCPDGGCPLPCESCDLHDCPLKCHKQKDHSTPCVQQMLYQSPAENATVIYRPPLIRLNCERPRQPVKEKQERGMVAQQRRRDEEQTGYSEAPDKLNPRLAERRRRSVEELRQERPIAIGQDLESIHKQILHVTMSAPGKPGPSVVRCAIPSQEVTSTPTFGQTTTPQPVTIQPVPSLPAITLSVPSQTHNDKRSQVERDPGVSDSIWSALNQAKCAADARERQATEEIQVMTDIVEAQREQEKAAWKMLRDLERQANKEPARKAEIEREKEVTRKRIQAIVDQKKAQDTELRAKKEEKRRKKQMEERAQRRLRELGVCVTGYRWINMGDSYRCAGGSHAVPMSQIENV